MMRYHYEKPDIYLLMYGKVYFCDHPVYHCCTLFQIGEKGLAVIQQRFDEKTKSTWWGEVDPWITDDLYLHPHFKEYFDMRMMGRAERRRAQKLEQKAKTATYNLTKAQLDAAVREQVGKELERIKQEAMDDAVNTAMVLLLTLPLEVLMDHYWTKSYAKRIPKFTELVLEYYERWQNGELDMDKLKEDLWEYGGVKLVESEGEAT